MDTEEATRRLRNTANGEWIINTVAPNLGENYSPPFSVETMDIPPGHSDGENEPPSEE